MKTIPLERLLAPALLLGLVFFGCKSRTEVEEKAAPPPAAVVSADVRVVATVNGDPITLAEFLERFNRAGFKPDREVELEVREEFLNRLIERKMMLREAQRRRIKVGLPEINKRIAAITEENGKDVKEFLASQGIDFEKWKSDVWEDMMVERLLARDVNRQISVSPPDVKRYYQTHQEEFDRPEQVHVRQIVVATEEEARKLLAQLQNDSADFAALARARSTAPEAEQGGDLGYFARGDMPAEFNIVFSLPKGGLSGVVKSPYGFHIFKLEGKRNAGRTSLDDAYKDIAEKLRRVKEDERYKSWLKELRSRTKFEVNYQALKTQP